MNTSSIIYSLFRERPFRGSLIWLAFVLALAGCDSANSGASGTESSAFSAALAVSKTTLKPGETTDVYATLKNQPEGLRFRWVAERGQFDPQDSDKETTTYIAPSSFSEAGDLTVNITLEFVQAGKVIGKKEASIVVKKEELAQQQEMTDQKKEASQQKEVIARRRVDPDPITPPVSLQTPQGNRARPKIRITKVPPSEPRGQNFYPNAFAGEVSGVDDPEQFRLVLYAQTDKWYVQPYTASPYTKIMSDRTWSNSTHSGERYAALLVKRSFIPPATTPELPEIGGEVVAKIEVEGKRP